MPAAVGSLASQVSPGFWPSGQLRGPGAHWSISFHSAGHERATGTPADLQDRLKGSSPVRSPQTQPPGGRRHVLPTHSKQQTPALYSQPNHFPSGPLFPFTKPRRETGPVPLRGGSANQYHPPPLCCWFTTRKAQKLRAACKLFTAFDIATQPSTQSVELSC